MGLVFEAISFLGIPVGIAEPVADIGLVGDIGLSVGIEGWFAGIVGQEVELENLG